MTRRGFTLMELVIVVGIILLLATLALSVSTALLARTERQKMSDTLSILDAAVREWEASNGRQLTIGPQTGSMTFDVKEVNSPGAYMIVPLLDLLQKDPASRELLARIPPEMIRRLPPGNAAGQWPGGVAYPVTIIEPRDIIDPWGQRIAVVNPGHPLDRYELAAGTAADPDGTKHTADENWQGGGGTCQARRIRFVSTGPDGQAATLNPPVGLTEAIDPKVADNIFSYGGPR